MKKPLFIVFFLCILASCKKNEEVDPKPTEKAAIVNHYAALGFAIYSDAVAKAIELKVAVDAFVTAPSQSGLDACKTAWKNSRVPYAHNEAFRFYGGPIDNAEDGPEGYLNAWPLDESYIDYIGTNSVSGIINDLATYPDITTSLLSSLNQASTEEGVSTGYHAIEFLLWGQDLNANGPGARPYTDYIDGGTAANQSRRRKYLVTVCEMLVSDLQHVADGWDPSVSGNYRTTFISAAETNNSLAKILIGLAKYTNGEMSGERISVAYQHSDQEDEHDCFSDYTMTDIRNWQDGLKGVYFGNYVRSNGTTLSGTSLSSYLKKYNADVNTNVSAKFATTDSTLALITNSFDNAILTSNADYNKVGTLIQNLREQAESYFDMVNNLGVLREYNGLDTAE